MWQVSNGSAGSASTFHGFRVLPAANKTPSVPLSQTSRPRACQADKPAVAVAEINHAGRCVPVRRRENCACGRGRERGVLYGRLNVAEKILGPVHGQPFGEPGQKRVATDAFEALSLRVKKHGRFKVSHLDVMIEPASLRQFRNNRVRYALPLLEWRGFRKQRLDDETSNVAGCVAALDARRECR